MKCLICKHFDVVSGTATIALERGDTTIVVKNVVARICPNCGEEYVGQAEAVCLLKGAEQRAVTSHLLPSSPGLKSGSS